MKDKPKPIIKRISIIHWLELKEKICSMIIDEKNHIKSSGYLEILKLMNETDGNLKYWGIDAKEYDKEEIKWRLEFGNVTRTEKLEFPTWEQIQPESESDSTTFTFNSKNGTEYRLLVADYGDDDFYDWTIEVYSASNDFSRDFPFTYDGYLEACQLCKKLFLGGK